MSSMRRPRLLSFYAYLQFYEIVPVLLSLYRIFLSEYRPFLTWRDGWLIKTDFYLIEAAMHLACAFTALQGSRWTRHFYISWLLVFAFAMVFATRYGGVHIPPLVTVIELVPLALLFTPSVSNYLMTRRQISVRWPGLGTIVTVVCCVFSLGVFSLFMQFMLATAVPYDSLESARSAFTVPGIVLLATLFGNRNRPDALHGIGLALVAGVASNMLLAADFAIEHVLNDRLHSTYVVWCWIVFTAVGAGLVAYAALFGQRPEPEA